MPTATGKTSATRRRTKWRNASHDERRQLIIGCAMDMLQRKGLGDVTMRNVAKRIGVGTMTLYTYIAGQDELRTAMAMRGFDMLHEFCDAASMLDDHEDRVRAWRGGSRAYIRFAVDHPNLYDLMFSIPPERGGANPAFLGSGFDHLRDKVRLRLQRKGDAEAEIEQVILKSAGRFWIALHGLASLAIANRLGVLGGDLDELLDDLLERVAPD